MNSALRALKEPLWMFLLFFSTAYFNSRLQSLETPFVELPEASEQVYDAKLFRVMSFGHLPAALDWILIQALLDPGIGKNYSGIHPQLYSQLDILTELDPLFSEAYVVGANLLAIVRKDPLGAKVLLLRGKAFIEKDLLQYPQAFRDHYWSRPWQLYVLLAYVNLFELEDMPHAAEAFRAASSYAGSPAYLARLAKRLEAPGGEYEVGVRLLNFMLFSDRSVEEKKVLTEKLKNLTLAKFVFDAKTAFEKDSDLKKTQPVLHWARFLRTHPEYTKDPSGGRLFIDPQTQALRTTTPYSTVFGLK